MALGEKIPILLIFCSMKVFLYIVWGLLPISGGEAGILFLSVIVTKVSADRSR